MRWENISEDETDTRQHAEVFLGEELTYPQPKFGGEIDLSYSSALTRDNKELDEVPN